MHSVSEEFQFPERRGGFFAAISRGLRVLILPAVFIAVGGYFIWHAKHGERGLLARDQRQLQITEARVELDRVRAEQQAMERRVQALRGDRLDRDQLDERARQLLNMVGRDEIVVPYGPTGRLF